MRSGTTGQGSNSANVRLYNERVILSALRRLGQASKADLARYANFTDNTAGVIVRDLETRGLIRAEGRRSGYRGQPATLLTLNAAGAVSIGAKIGRRSIDVLMVDFCGQVLARRRHERPFPQPEEAVSAVLDAMDAFGRMRAGKAPRAPAGLGVATPYNMGAWRRELDLPSDALDAWNDFDIAARLAGLTGLPVLCENDGTAATVAELFQGQGRHLDDFLYVFIGAAIGGGVVLGGDYHRGVSGNAGDIGLMPVPGSRLSTAPPPQGNFDVLLTRASLNSLIRHLRGNGATIDSRADLDAAIAERAGPVAEWVEDCADALTGPIFSAVRILDVPTVVLDGDLPSGVLDGLVARLNDLLVGGSPEARRPPALRRGLVGREAAAIGAALLPLHLNFSPNRQILLGQETNGGPARPAS